MLSSSAKEQCRFSIATYQVLAPHAPALGRTKAYRKTQAVF